MDASVSLRYRNADKTYSHDYLVPPVLGILAGREQGRLLDIGCGNGSKTAEYAAAGWDTVGIDLAEDGIEHASKTYGGRFAVGSAYDDHRGNFGVFRAVVSLEVVEHLYDPPRFAAAAFDCLEPGGTLVASTPYHGYAKNVLIALRGGFDRHWHPLTVGGHIKFWSPRTLGRLLENAGFADVRFHRVGRAIPAFAKSMIAVARKP